MDEAKVRAEIDAIVRYDYAETEDQITDLVDRLLNYANDLYLQGKNEGILEEADYTIAYHMEIRYGV